MHSRPPRSRAQFKGWKGAATIALVLLGSAASASLAASPSAATSAANRIYLISTRRLGDQCECSAMAAGLHCEEFTVVGGIQRWRPIAWKELISQFDEPLPIVIFVHGNRVAAGDDKPHGLSLYQAMVARRPDSRPMRFIIWSWPSAKVPGIVRDYQLKASRTQPVGWQLAWAIDQMPSDGPLALVGYSYGARVVTGALHLLAGGELGPLRLSDRLHPDRAVTRVALLAAAVDAPWIRPGGYHGRALEQVGELLLINNHLDPAMRFYHVAFAGRVRPLGYAGSLSLAGLGAYRDRVRTIDVTEAVGRHHALPNYLAANSRYGPVPELLVRLP